MATHSLSILWGNQLSSPMTKTFYRGGALQDYERSFGDLFVAKQEHGIRGSVVEPKMYQSWAKAVPMGDYLITSQPGTWIGILTADCLPIIFYSSQPQVVAIAHAGWRGSVAGIAKVVVTELQNKFVVNPQDLQVFFGPAAGVCCYEVDQKFVDNLSQDQIAMVCLSGNGPSYFFDNLRYNMLCLQKCGVPSSNFQLRDNQCTICNLEYCSYRRFGEETALQLSAVALR